jgi:hypothetical protein
MEGGECVGSVVAQVGDGIVWMGCRHNRKQCLHVWRIRNQFVYIIPIFVRCLEKIPARAVRSEEVFGKHLTKIGIPLFIVDDTINEDRLFVDFNTKLFLFF